MNQEIPQVARMIAARDSLSCPAAAERARVYTAPETDTTTLYCQNTEAWD
ncbi:MAG: hypothetical protein IJ168_07885 [Eubacterium sp.]|nr:hypothetical protein [Eubacterium sp.]